MGGFMAVDEQEVIQKVTPIEAYLSLPSFLAIVSSSVETFRKETIGYLVGIKGENKFMVEYAIPYQTADSGYVHATIDMERVARINDILNKLAQGLEFIGDFHSHTAFGESPATVIPSNTDLTSTVPGELNLICAVNEKKRSVRWRENSRGILVGTIRQYRIEIGGYYVEKPTIGRKYQRVNVKCPAITGLEEEKKT
jgi:proteasome lid subunit RPN8/RPN11